MVDRPEVYVFDSGSEDEAAEELALRVTSLDLEAPFVLTSEHGTRLAARLEGPRPPETAGNGANQDWAERLGARAKRSGADAIVAIGGGRCLDVGKLAAARAGLVLIAVPTQLSHDGICSPVAVVPGADGRTASLGAIQPRAVYLSLPTLDRSPDRATIAGIGDLLANPLALRDWALAAEKGLERTNPAAWDLSVRSFESIEPYLDRNPNEFLHEPGFLRTLAEALIDSGTAMIEAGTSRPASGAEHEISHAIDGLFGGRGMHGEQVALGCVVSVALWGESTDRFRERLGLLGLPDHPAALNLGSEDLVKVLLEAPGTRPGRYTVLEEANLDTAGSARLIGSIWPDLR